MTGYTWMLELVGGANTWWPTGQPLPAEVVEEEESERHPELDEQMYTYATEILEYLASGETTYYSASGRVCCVFPGCEYYYYGSHSKSCLVTKARATVQFFQLLGEEE